MSLTDAPNLEDIDTKLYNQIYRKVRLALWLECTPEKVEKDGIVSFFLNHQWRLDAAALGKFKDVAQKIVDDVNGRNWIEIPNREEKTLEIARKIYLEQKYRQLPARWVQTCFAVGDCETTRSG